MDKQKNNSPDIEKLLAKMGPRTTPNAEKSAASKAAVRSHWQQVVNDNKRQRRTYLWAAAASIMLAVSMLVLNLNQSPDNMNPQMLASVTTFSGQVQWQQADGDWQDLHFNDVIEAGTVIKTADQSYLSLKLTDQSEIRLAANSEILTLPDVIELRFGQLYHDTDEVQAASPLIIQTSQGTVEHIGTRYLVSSQQGEVKVAVRSGQVKMTTDSQTQKEHILLSNQMAVINTADDVAEISEISSYDDLWGWTFIAQADFDLNNRSLHDFVQWFAQQSGLAVDWQNLESSSKRVRLQGNIKNMSQEQAIKTVFYSTQYSYAINDGVLQISHQKQ